MRKQTSGFSLKIRKNFYKKFIYKNTKSDSSTTEPAEAEGDCLSSR